MSKTKTLMLCVAALSGLAYPCLAQDVLPADQNYVVSGSERIAATGSMNEVTRISAEGEAFLSVIDSVNVDGVAVDYQILDSTGDIFVSVTGGKSGQRFSAFAVTANNTYNINLTLRDVPAQQVSIRNQQYLFEVAAEEARLQAEEESRKSRKSARRGTQVVVKTGSAYKLQLATIMRAIYYRSDIKGFDRDEQNRVTVLPSGVSMTLNTVWESPSLVAKEYLLSTTDGTIQVADQHLVSEMKPLVWSVTDPMVSASTTSRLLVIEERSDG